MIPATHTIHCASTVKDHSLCEADDVVTTKNLDLVNCPKCKGLMAKVDKALEFISKLPPKKARTR